MAELTAHRLRELLDYDPATGEFTRRVSLRRWKAGTVSGTRHREGYWQVRVDGRLYKAHRLAWLHVTGEWPQNEIDHRDGDNSNNRFANLRDVTSEVNKQNQRRGHVGSTSPLLGVSWARREQKWLASITVRRKFRSLGYFDTEAQAHTVYLQAKRDMHVGCTI